MSLIDGQNSDGWEQLETFAMILAYVHKQHGLDGMLKVLGLDTKDTFTREDLQQAANELKARGLIKAATALTEAAANKPSMLDLRFCPYLTEPYLSNPDNQYNIDAWLRQRRRQLQRMRPH